MKRKIICVVGPTASGKTSLALFLAKKLNGEIVSADSRQVYKKLDIGTGKDLKDYGDVKYQLIDICEPGKKFTLFDWLELAKKEIEKLFEQNITPIIVGGTGLYVQALVEGFVQEKSKIQNSKFKFQREDLDKMTAEELQKICSQLKIENSQLDINNPRRLIRAIELAQEGTKPSKQKPDFEVLQIGITLEREKLFEKIDARVEQWFREGFMQEVGQLLKDKVSPQWLFEVGLEYRIASKYILANSELRIASCEEDRSKEFSEMKQQMKFAIHHYARRQLTWFRRFTDIVWVDSKGQALSLGKQFLK